MSEIKNEIVIDGIKYIREDVSPEDVSPDLEYVLVRTRFSGVYCGHLESQIGSEVILKDVRWIWYWDGAITLTELATNGTTKPEKCKFPKAIKKIKLLDAHEIIPVSEKAKKSIMEVSEWKQ